MASASIVTRGLNTYPKHTLIRRRVPRFPAMSSSGWPYDNAVMETFFVILKTECLYRAHFSTHVDVEQPVAEYVHFYNFGCISLKNSLTPIELRGKAA